MDYLFILIGGFFLFLGGEALLKGSVSIARQFNMSKLLIGAVVVGFGTSMPEMSVSVKAALDNAPDIVLGNVIGSNIANILLILGICGVVVPITMTDRGAMRDGLVVVFSSALLCGIALFMGVVNFWAGLGLFSVLLIYIVWSYRLDQEKTKKQREDTARHVEEDIEGDPQLSFPVALGFCAAGIALLVLGAWLFVEGCVNIARTYGISEAVIGLSLVAIGTSLPELATSFIAALRRHGDVIVGNVLGSCLFNLLAILGISAMIKPINVTGHIIEADMWVLLGVSVLILPFLWTDRKISRIEASVMLLLYTGYIGWLYTSL